LINSYECPINKDCLKLILSYFEANKKSETVIRNFLHKNKDRFINDQMTILLLKKYNCADVLQNFEHRENIKLQSLSETNTKKILEQNYRELVKQIFSFNNKITVMLMQYPTLSVDILKEELKQSKYYDRLIFISNEENFNNSLKKYNLEHIFTDMFGKSFGHCTKLGNTIIAENVAKVILELYDNV
ncbi:MAG: hypothetical protein PHR82_06350, partial [Endomicrobiaceae bacterium]|nr:hypothetical protein [Endomicrobiaceae bacterium]